MSQTATPILACLVTTTRLTLITARPAPALATGYADKRIRRARRTLTRLVARLGQ